MLDHYRKGALGEFQFRGELPKRILLATDLSARCDRALDRAVQLSKLWQAGLTAVHALEQPEAFYTDELERRLPSWRRPPDPRAIAESQLRQDLQEAAADVVTVVERGNPADVILREAEAIGAELIVTGIARDEILGRFFLGGTVDRLIRGTRIPILIVKQRVRTPYQHVVIATDFSDYSRGALHVALGLFPDAPLDVLHAYDTPLRGRFPDPAELEREYAQQAAEDYAVFLASSGLSAADRGRLSPIAEPGDPRDLIHLYTRDKNVDLVVLGTQGRSAPLSALLGNTAQTILTALPCDALLVRQPRSAGAPEA